ncbi:hypothetical protein [Aequorivita nionensis]|uniref:hypothetical protein n=1 Tax=Aequorivita nionensis TaxID=1287690 RepID=UPI003965CF7F
MDSDKIHGKWNYSYQYFDSEDSITVDWPIETLVFEENGTFIIRTDSEELSGKYEFMDSSIVLKEVSKNGIKQEGQEILFLSNLDSLTLTIQARMETGILYVEYEKEKN